MSRYVELAILCNPVIRPLDHTANYLGGAPHRPRPTIARYDRGLPLCPTYSLEFAKYAAIPKTAFF